MVGLACEAAHAAKVGTLTTQDPQEAQAVKLELEALSLWLLRQLLSVLLHPLQSWFQVMCMNLQLMLACVSIVCCVVNMALSLIVHRAPSLDLPCSLREA